MNDSKEDEPISATSNCRNCGAEFGTSEGKYCPSCGQKRSEPHELAVGHFFGHLLHEITHLDSNKIVKTFTALIVRPGLLTKEYLAGRKGHHINPIRVYLTVSALYFLFAWGALAAAGGGDAQSNQGRPYIIRQAETKGVDPAVFAVQVQEKAGKYSAILRFASVMLSGLFLMVLYRGSQKYYVEHLIFSLHFYSFDFLAKCVVAVFYLTSAYTGHYTYLTLRIGYYAVAFAYLFFALRRVYEQSTRTTFLKAAAQFLFEVVVFLAINIIGFMVAVGIG